MTQPLPRVVIMTPVAPDFMVGPIETEVRDDGSTVRFQICGELIDGRWEGFVTIIEDTRDSARNAAHKYVCHGHKR